MGERDVTKACEAEGCPRITLNGGYCERCQIARLEAERDRLSKLAERRLRKIEEGIANAQRLTREREEARNRCAKFVADAREQRTSAEQAEAELKLLREWRDDEGRTVNELVEALREHQQEKAALRAERDEALAALANPKSTEPIWCSRCERLEAERDDYRAANEAAAVCAKHASEFTSEGCLVCDAEELQAERDRLREALERSMVDGHAHDCVNIIRKEPESFDGCSGWCRKLRANLHEEGR